MPHRGAPLTRGRLTVAVAPFVDQDAFDRRLWLSDLNFVRGEDSFVRAQWAGQPYVWHAYPQEGDAHLVKMDAFLTRLEATLPDGIRIDQRTFWYAWNTATRGGGRGLARLPLGDARRDRPRPGLGAGAGPSAGPRVGTGQIRRKSFIMLGFPHRNTGTSSRHATPRPWP